MPLETGKEIRGSSGYLKSSMIQEMVHDSTANVNTDMKSITVEPIKASEIEEISQLVNRPKA